MSKTIPKLRFKEFRMVWSNKTLEDVAIIARGKSRHRPRDASFLYGGPYPFIQTGDIRTAELYITTFNQTYSEDGLKQSKLWDEGTLCITIAANIAETAILKIKACFPDSVIGLLPKEGESDTLFIKYLFDKFKIEIQSLSQGLAQANLNLEKLSSLKFSIPSLPEQQKIASFLSAVDEKIQRLTRKKELLEQYKKGVMQQLFSGKLRFKDENGKPYPKWEEKKLGEIADFLRGSPLSKSDLKENGKYLCIHYGELFTVYKEVIVNVFSRTDKEEGVLSVKGDILMPSSDVTPKGLAKASSIQHDNVILGGDINILRPSSVDSIFLSYLLNFNQNKIIQIVTGTTVKHIYNKDVRILKFSLPSSKGEQQKITSFLIALDAKIESVATQIAHTQTFKKGLLQQMFV